MARTDSDDLLPARMLNEFVYCPRLGYLEWVEGEWADNYFTEDGRWQHRRVDEGGGVLPLPDDSNDELLRARSVLMSAPIEALIARMDIVETQDGVACPVDYKRGEIPGVEQRVHDPERVQLCAQGLVLRENGWLCDGGWIYFVASRSRVWVAFDDALVSLTREKAREFTDRAERRDKPLPLEDSPKCVGCSLVGICLPDEVNLLAQPDQPSEDGDRVRRLLPARPDALPLYVQKAGTSIGIRGEVLQVREKGELIQDVRLLDVSQVNLMGNVQITSHAIRELCTRNIPIVWFSGGGWYYGMAVGLAHKNVFLRQAQYRYAFSPRASLRIARSIVSSKIMNCRTLLRRNHSDLSTETRAELLRYARQAHAVRSMKSLLGIEGMAARIYFSKFSGMLKQKGLEFDFTTRNRRPPRDPINSMLSFLYAILLKDLGIVLQAIGFDSFQGFYHQPRYGKPALALDLMEEFRPLIADSTVVWVVNNGVVSPEDFYYTAGAAAMKTGARKRLIEAYERRMDTLITHPTFGYRISYRRLLEVQARLLGRHVQGELTTVPTFRTR